LEQSERPIGRACQDGSYLLSALAVRASVNLTTSAGTCERFDEMAALHPRFRRSSCVRAAVSGFVLLVCGTAAGADPHPASVGAPSSGGKGAAARPTARISSKGARSVDLPARRAIAGGPTQDDSTAGVESPELKVLRDVDRELFPPGATGSSTPWPLESTLVLPGDPARLVPSGVPAARSALPDLIEGAARDPAWLSRLELPDLPVRWDERVVRYLEFFRDDPRGRSSFSSLYRHSGRWRETMRRAFRRRSLPEDLVWVAMVESGFDTAARSAAGAAGLWQFMPETAKIYGLGIDRWVDQRYSPNLATDAAADFLGDLHRRFGSWELALAAYNMGYAGLASVVKRYNTNDFWSLARTEGTLPWETTLYVPRILASAIVAHNLATFGMADLQVDSPFDADEVPIPAGTPLALVAQAAGCSQTEIDALNPELRASRTPPASEGDVAYPVRVPPGKATAVGDGLSKLRKDAPSLDRYVVRFGETLEQIAASHRTTTAKIVDVNAISPGEVVRGGTVLLVPHVDAPRAEPVAASPGPKQAIVVPQDVFVYPDRKRVFYRAQPGDSLRDVADALHVPLDDLRRWNALDAAARLQPGMTLQAFVGQDADLSRVAVVTENDVRVLPVGSDEFFAALEKDRAFKRIVVTAKAGDTLETIGKHFDVPARTMERINRKGRAEPLHAGESVVVYATAGTSAVPGNARTASADVTATSSDPTQNGPLPLPPLPDLLPDLLH
jgi:membrane-bound lytic murein transglycosylase D